MKLFLRVMVFAALLVFAANTAHAADAAKPAPLVLPVHMLGKTDAPVKVDEYVSLTCPHCAEFYNDTLPELEKRYVDTGKVRFVLHNYVRDGSDLRAAVLAECMPPDEFFPFIKILFQNQQAWALSADPEKTLISYAKLGGLSDEKAHACLKDTRMQDAVVAERTAVESKVEATPAFIINDGADKVDGAVPAADFARKFDKLLAADKP